MAVSASEDLGEITEFTGNVVSVNVNANSFVMQGPTAFRERSTSTPARSSNGSNSLSTLVADAIVSVIGTMQADGTILAGGVELITTNKAFISGRILAVNPTSGPVADRDHVGRRRTGNFGVIPADTVQTIDLSAVSTYDICFFDNLLTQQLFNDSSLVVAQRIFIGGVVSGGAFTPQMVSLRRQGVVGALVANSVTVTEARAATRATSRCRTMRS